MFISPVLTKSNTPKEYTNRARDEINRKLNINNTSTTLRHGPSPLQRVMSTASDLSLTRTASNDSMETVTTEKRKNGFFGRLRHRNTNKVNDDQQIHAHESCLVDDRDSVMSDNVENEAVISMDMDMPHLRPVPSVASTTVSAITSDTMSTHADSLFSTANTLGTTYTELSNTDYQQFNYHQQQSKSVMLTLEQAIPRNFSDMYSPELMADPSLLVDGRPLFTKRALQDWELNDIRSLLIVEKLKPEWNNQLPIIYLPQGFKFEYLPLDADDETVVRTLVHSDIYKEAKLDSAFREQTAKYTLSAARLRHEQIIRASGMQQMTSYMSRCLSKPEWRNVIENYLLNLAVEAQCRTDFKKMCHDLKKWRRQQQNPSVSPAKFVNTNKGSLLRKAIMNDVSQSSPQPTQVKLSKEEKAQLWTDVQEKVYKRIGLDWTPDKITA